MKLNTNILALETSSALSKNNRALGKSSARLSSGVRLRTAADGGAETAIVTKINLRLGGTSKASNNAADATTLLQTADGALAEIRAMVQRIRELAVQAGNDTLSEDDREKIQVEIDGYKDEITASARRTDYNGIKIINGDAGDILSATNNTQILKISDTIKAGTYGIEFARLPDGSIDESSIVTTGFANTAVASASGQILTISDVDDKKVILDLTHSVSGVKIDLSIEEKGLVFQVGANQGVETKVRIPKISTETLELNEVLVNCYQSADLALESCDKAIRELAIYSARIGAYVNRFGYTLTNLKTTEFNMESSMSRINDTDMAREMIEYTRAQVLAQTDISLLAQANQRPQQLLALIR